MSRCALVVSSSLLLAMSGCAEEPATVFPRDAATVADAGGDGGRGSSATGSVDDDDGNAPSDAGPTRSGDAGARADAGLRGGLDAGPGVIIDQRGPDVTGVTRDAPPGNAGPATPGVVPAGDGPTVTDVSRDGTSSAQPPSAPDAERRPLIEARSSVFDTTSHTSWQFLDLESAQLGPSPEAVPGWDVALRRYAVQLNGGNGVQASIVDGTSFDGVTRAPAGGWSDDGPDGVDQDTDPDWFISTFETGTGWYDYDEVTHQLAPKQRVYAVRTGDDRYFKLTVNGFYNAQGTSGWLGLSWGEVEAP